MATARTLAIRKVLALAALAMTPIIVSATTGVWQSDRTAADHTPGNEAFRARVDAYVKLQETAARALPPLGETSDPERLNAHQQALAASVRQYRPQAREGDIFGEDTAERFRGIIRDDFSKRPRTDKQSLREDMPRRARLEVNDSYPADWPLATFPAALLARLPELPPTLEYRMVRRDLVLFDNVAGLVVDVLRNAFPD